MTVALEEADSLIQLAKANNLVLQVGHLERFNPAVVAAREYVQQPLFVESHRLASFTERGTEVDVILDIMIHDIDIILSLVPYPLEDIRVGGVKVLTPHTCQCHCQPHLCQKDEENKDIPTRQLPVFGLC
jgi:predicted dehydrogenase